jgi:uncharacterized membrane protein
MNELLFLFLVLQLLQGSTYTVDVADPGYAVITHEVIVTAPEPLDVYSYYLPFPISHFEVYSDKAVTGDFTVLGEQTEIILYISLEEGESAYCVCEYLTWDIISKEGQQWRLYLPSMEESVTVVMPRGVEISYLVTESDFPTISEEIGRITLFWEYLPDEVYVYYELSLGGSISRYWMIIPLVGAMGAAFYVFRRLRSKKLSKAVLSVLDEREQRIVEYLHTKGRCRQAKISRALQIPKTSLSKIVIRMEERGIIRRERDGNLTYCELDEKIYQ